MIVHQILVILMEHVNPKMERIPPTALAIVGVIPMETVRAGAMKIGQIVLLIALIPIATIMESVNPIMGKIQLIAIVIVMKIKIIVMIMVFVKIT
jgi:hypothetical protein